MYTVTSEIYSETNYNTIEKGPNKVISKFKFRYPADDDDNESVNCAKLDEDGDTIVQRSRFGCIELEHAQATELKLVGLQVWRGALLLADYIFSRRQEFSKLRVLELGAGVGLTSIAAAIYAPKVTCTDVDLGCILNLLNENINRNSQLLCGETKVLECDFMRAANEQPETLWQAIDESDAFLAADVIYDTKLTDAFIRIIDAIFARSLATSTQKKIYIALEKRYVFTTAEYDVMAPMFEYFIAQTMNKPWQFTYPTLDFPQYFCYERCKELVLIILTYKK